MEIIVRKFSSHYNKALGKEIHTKRQYNEEMKRQGMVSQEKGDDIAKRAREKSHRDYKVDKETARFIAEVKDSGVDGKVKLGSRALDFMEKKGVSFKRPKERPMEGGFEDAV